MWCFMCRLSRSGFRVWPSGVGSYPVVLSVAQSGLVGAALSECATEPYQPCTSSGRSSPMCVHQCTSLVLHLFWSGQSHIMQQCTTHSAQSGSVCWYHNALLAPCPLYPQRGSPICIWSSDPLSLQCFGTGSPTSGYHNTLLAPHSLEHPAVDARPISRWRRGPCMHTVLPFCSCWSQLRESCLGTHYSSPEGWPDNLDRVPACSPSAEET